MNRARVWIGGWIALVAMLELAGFLADRREPDVSVFAIVTDSYVGDPVRLASFVVENNGDRSIEVRSLTLEWLGARIEVPIQRAIAAGSTSNLEEVVSAPLRPPDVAGSYPITLSGIDAIVVGDRDVVARPHLPALPRTTTIAVMNDGGRDDGFRDFLAASRVCGPAPAPSAALTALPTAERESIRTEIIRKGECIALARSAAHAPHFTAPAPRRYTFPYDASLRWLDVGRWLVLAGAEAEWRGDVQTAWTAYLDALLLAIRLQVATWRHDSVETIFATRVTGPPRAELVRLLDDGHAPTAALARSYLELISPLLVDLDQSIAAEAFAITQPEDVLRPLRYDPLAPLYITTLRGMALSVQGPIVRKRFAHLVRTRALFERLERAAITD